MNFVRFCDKINMFRGHSSAGQSARFTCVRSRVRTPLPPPKPRSQKRTGFLFITSYFFTINKSGTRKRSQRRRAAGAVSRQLLACAASPRLYSARCAEMLRKNALRFWRAADCLPYGNGGKIGAESSRFLRKKK